PLLVYTFPSLIHPPQKSTLFPYTTLFRSIKLSIVLSDSWKTLNTLMVFQVRCPFGWLNWSASCWTLGGCDISLSSNCSAPTLPSDRKSTRLNSSHVAISYAVFCLKKKIIQ